MLWGHKVGARGGQVEVTRAQYNKAFGFAVPKQPALPDHAHHAWLTWFRLNERRPASSSVCPIPYIEIESFSRLAGEQIAPDDLRMIEAIDNAYISAITEERAAAEERRSEARPTIKKR